MSITEWQNQKEWESLNYMNQMILCSAKKCKYQKAGICMRLTLEIYCPDQEQFIEPKCVSFESI